MQILITIAIVLGILIIPIGLSLLTTPRDKKSNLMDMWVDGLVVVLILLTIIFIILGAISIIIGVFKMVGILLN